MTEIIEKTVSTSVPTTKIATESQTSEYVIYFIFGLIEILIGFRILFKVVGASTSSMFVNGIYGITKIFILPFEGIFRRGFAQGVETTSVLEPSAIVAILVYMLLAWGIVNLVRIGSGEKQAA